MVKKVMKKNVFYTEIRRQTVNYIFILYISFYFFFKITISHYNKGKLIIQTWKIKKHLNLLNVHVKQATTQVSDYDSSLASHSNNSKILTNINSGVV